MTECLSKDEELIGNPYSTWNVIWASDGDLGDCYVEASLVGVRYQQTTFDICTIQLCYYDAIAQDPSCGIQHHGRVILFCSTPKNN
jgi:hypothetical protein